MKLLRIRAVVDHGIGNQDYVSRRVSYGKWPTFCDRFDR